MLKHVVEPVALKNGMKGLMIDVPDAPVVSFNFHVRAGYYLVERDKIEIPHLLEHMVPGANVKYPKARSFHMELEKNGAFANASSSSHSINYLAECADFEWERIVNLLVLALEKPIFNDSEFRAEVGNVREELAGDLNNHFRHLSLALQKELGFIAMTDQQRLQNIPNVALDDIEKHFHHTHRTDNIRFIVAGDLSAKQASLSTHLEQLGLKRGERFELPEEEPRKLGSPLYVEDESVKNVHFFLNTFAKRELKQTERDALGLLNTMLTATLHSLMLGEARERGLVYHMSSNYVMSRDSTGWWFGAQVMEENSQGLFDIIIKHLRDVLNGKITAKDIKAAQQYELGRYQRGTQTVGSLANGYSGMYFFDETIEDHASVPERIKGLRKEQLVDAAQTLFTENVWGLGVLGSCGQTHANTLHRQLATLWE